MHIVEVSKPSEENKPYVKKAIDIQYPADVPTDIPSGIQVGSWWLAVHSH
jgi:hypothetical protein